MSTCGRSRIPSLSKLSQLYHYLKADPDPASSPFKGGVRALIENDLRLETHVGPVQHWPLEIDPINVHLGSHLPAARLVNGRQGTGTSSRSTLADLLTWHCDQCKGAAPWPAARSADHREVW